MGFAKDSRERQMFAEFYTLNEKYWNCTEEQFRDDTFWDGLVEETMAFTQKYKTEADHFSVRLAALICERVDAQYKHILPYCEATGDFLIASIINWKIKS